MTSPTPLPSTERTAQPTPAATDEHAGVLRYHVTGTTGAACRVRIRQIMVRASTLGQLARCIREAGIDVVLFINELGPTIPLVSPSNRKGERGRQWIEV